MDCALTWFSLNLEFFLTKSQFSSSLRRQRPRILDNINDWSFILEHRALLQSNFDFHKLGESQTSVFSYTVFLWAVPVAITLDLDVDSKSAFEKSDRLRTNVLLDCLQPGWSQDVLGPKLAVED